MEKKIRQGSYKTRLCKFYEKGYCNKHNNCTYAHGKKELRSRQRKQQFISEQFINPQPFFNPAICQNWQNGMCQQGQYCNMVHLCQNWQRGMCQFGQYCNLTHGVQQYSQYQAPLRGQFNEFMGPYQQYSQYQAPFGQFNEFMGTQRQFQQGLVVEEIQIQNYQDFEQMMKYGQAGKTCSLKLDYSDLQEFERRYQDQFIFILATEVEKMQCLEDLDLNFWSGYPLNVTIQVHPNGWIKFFDSFKILINLKNLTLNIVDTKQSGLSLKKLSESFVSLTKLEKLHLNLGWIDRNYDIHKKGWKYLFCSFRTLTNLRDLRLGGVYGKIIKYGQVYGMKISNESMILLSQSLLHLKKLSELTINLYGNQLAEKSWGFFLHSVSQLKELSKLELWFEYSNIGNYGISMLNASNMKKLKEVKIRWYGTKISENRKDNFINSMKDLGFGAEGDDFSQTFHR